MRIAQAGERRCDPKTRGRKTHGAKYADRASSRFLGYHFHCTSNTIWSFPVLTWAEGVTRQLLDALTFTDGPTIEWGGVGTAACAFLVATATSAVTHGPLCPCGPSSIDCWLNKH